VWTSCSEYKRSRSLCSMTTPVIQQNSTNQSASYFIADGNKKPTSAQFNGDIGRKMPDSTERGFVSSGAKPKAKQKYSKDARWSHVGSLP
jgi:hypothetical protein